MATAEDGKFKMPDGFEVYTRTWKPASEPIAALIFIHGFSDHANRYNDLMSELNKAGIIVYAFDQRGWGQSVADKGSKGLTGTSERVMGDIAAFVDSHLPSSIPVFMMGHSMGGQETLHFAAGGSARKQIKGYILSSPYIALHPAEQPSWLKIRAGRLASKALPKFQLVNPLKAENMSHDPIMNQDLKDDPLCHDTGTLEGLAGMLDRAEQLDNGEVLVEDWDGLHMLFLHGTGDRVTPFTNTQKYIEKINVKNKQLKSYDDGYHCVFYEPAHKEKYAADIVEFITTRSKEEQAGKAPGSSDGQSKL